MALLKSCRGAYNRLGLGYQLCHLKLFNRFPAYHPFIAVDELVGFVAVQLDVPMEHLSRYTKQKATFFRHQDTIRAHLKVKKYSRSVNAALEDYLMQLAQQIQVVESFFIKATEFLKERKVLSPSDDTIERLIQTQREKARTATFAEIAHVITPELKQALDDLLIVDSQ